MKHVFFLSFLIALGMLSSCDYVTMPYPKNKVIQGGGTGFVKKVLLEDYTATQCTNCPAAGIIADGLRTANGGRVITIGVHIGSLSQPSGTVFTQDFRTTAGNNYNNLFVNADATGYPSGMVDRVFIGNPAVYFLGTGNWVSSVNSRLMTQDSAFLTISNTYSSTTRTLSTKVLTTSVSPLPNTYRLTVLLTEDSIQAPQKDQDSTQLPNATVINYWHRYVLRDAINNNHSGWGDTLTLPHHPSVVGDTVSKTYSYSIPSMFLTIPCNDKHCYVVAFLYDAATYEILQVEQQKVY